VTAITHRDDPILRGTIEGCLPGSYSENAVGSSIMRAATAWNVLDRSGVPGITDVWCPPVQAGINCLVRMQQSYRGQAKQAANALWGSTAAHVRYKHVTVVDDDIDIHDYAAVDWAIAHRVNAGENDIVIMPGTFGLGLDPSTRRRDRNPALFGTGKWNRVLIDATQNLDYDPDPDLGGARFPPTVWPNEGDVATVKARWGELGLDKLKRCVVLYLVGWVELLRNPPIHLAIETQLVGYGAIGCGAVVNALMAPNLTASRVFVAFDERVDQSYAHCCDRVGDVTFRPQWRILWVDNRRERQVAGRARRNEILRGESPLSRRSGIRRPRCTSWRDDGSRAIRALHSARARPPA
jgi:3-polyprenyl-4-hydroxybenzoate decarboxylase